jgi:hypothetical protein
MNRFEGMQSGDEVIPGSGRILVQGVYNDEHLKESSDGIVKQRAEFSDRKRWFGNAGIFVICV